MDEKDEASSPETPETPVVKAGVVAAPIEPEPAPEPAPVEPEPAPPVEEVPAFVGVDIQHPTGNTDGPPW